MSAQPANPKGEVRLIPSGFKCTDSGNGERFAARYRNDVRYVDARRKWLVWEGSRWVWDKDKSIELRTKELARSIHQESLAVGDMDQRKALQDWALKSEGAGKRKALLDLAAAESGITIGIDALDLDPWLLNCENGTLDLRTGALLPHAREHMITKSTGTTYNPFAIDSLWKTILRNMTGGDDELAAYLQRVAGYALTGMATERKFFFLYGPPGSGKSTFIEALISCMGDYACTTSFDTWLEHPQVGGNRDDLVELQGARLVTSGEVDASKRWDTAMLKKFTGGDRIKATAKFEKPIEYLATCTLIFAANDAPKAREDDSGFWERMQRVPITNVVPSAERIRDLHAQLRLPENREAILAWAVEGCSAWRDGGIGTASVVTSSSAEYRDENDWLGGFLEHYELAEPCSVAAKAFRVHYEEYCKQEGQRPEATKTLAKKLEKRTGGAVTYAKVHGGHRVWKGLRLIGAPPEEQPSLPVRAAPEPITHESEQRSLGFTPDPDDLEPPEGRFDDD